MNESEMLAWFAAWLVENEYAPGRDLGSRKVTDVLVNSLNIIEMAIDLEEAMGSSGGANDDIDLEELMPKFATLTFAELAAEIVKLTTHDGDNDEG